jgi:hypothetical protein
LGATAFADSPNGLGSVAGVGGGGGTHL